MDNQKNGRRYISHHILPAASNLLGLCFVILSFIKVSKLGAETVIDDVLVAPILMFMISCVFSYVSIRSTHEADVWERTADYFFLLGLSFLTIISLIVVFELVH